MNSPDDDLLNKVNSLMDQIIEDQQWEHSKLYDELKQTEADFDYSVSQAAQMLTIGLNPASVFGLVYAELVGSDVDRDHLVMILASVVTSRAIDKAVEQEAGELGGIS